MERNLEAYLVFVDLENAYDNVPLVKLFETLENSGINPMYVKSVYNVYRNIQARVKIGREVTESCNISKGLKQGCCLSFPLLELYIQDALETWKINELE